MALGNTKLFSSHKLGGGPLTVSHRISMAPLTRNRGTEPNLAAHKDHVDYYSQRASPGGLVITEAVPISPQAVGYVSVPGIWTDEQTESWKPVCDAVHAKGGVFFMQLWHTGRVAHPSFAEHPLLRRDGLPLPSVSASALPIMHPKGDRVLKTETYKGALDHGVPRALEESEMPQVVEMYKHACRNCLKAGFDGVEVHGAHGYLMDQFLRNGINQRTDRYGGSIENRSRLLYEVLAGCCEVMGPGRAAVRISPTYMENGRENAFYNGSTSDPDELYPKVVDGLNQFPLAYVLLSEPNTMTKEPDGNQPLINVGPAAKFDYRKIYKGTLMGSGGFTPATAAKTVEDGHYDIVAFGRWFISNPDLPDRIAKGAPLTVYNRSTFYTRPGPDGLPIAGSHEGYTDYPDLAGNYGPAGKYQQMEQDLIRSSLSNAAKEASKSKL